MIEFFGGLIFVLLVLVALGIVAAVWDPFGEQRDARRRAQEPRYWGKR